MLVQYLTYALAALPLVAGQTCNRDNCFRAIKGYQDQTSPTFCSAYLASQTTAPSPIATCGSTRLSSACSCLTTPVTTISTPPTVTTTTTSSTAVVPTNLIINGGFESSTSRSDLTPWTVTPSGKFWVANNTESSTFFPFRARTGTKSGQMSHSGQGEPITVLSQPVALTGGTNYKFAAYYSVLDIPFGTCYLNVAIDTSIISQTVIYPGAGGGNPPPYRKVSGTYAASSTGTATVNIEFLCDDSGLGLIGLDDVSLL